MFTQLTANRTASARARLPIKKSITSLRYNAGSDERRDGCEACDRAFAGQADAGGAARAGGQVRRAGDLYTREAAVADHRGDRRFRGGVHPATARAWPRSYRIRVHRPATAILVSSC